MFKEVDISLVLGRWMSTETKYPRLLCPTSPSKGCLLSLPTRVRRERNVCRVNEDGNPFRLPHLDGLSGSRRENGGPFVRGRGRGYTPKWQGVVRDPSIRSPLDR